MKTVNDFNVLNPDAGTITTIHFCTEDITIEELTKVVNAKFTGDELIIDNKFRMNSKELRVLRSQAIKDNISIVTLIPIVSNHLNKERTFCRLMNEADRNIIFDDGVFYVNKFRGTEGNLFENPHILFSQY